MEDNLSGLFHLMRRDHVTFLHQTEPHFGPRMLCGEPNRIRPRLVPRVEEMIKLICLQKTIFFLSKYGNVYCIPVKNSCIALQYVVFPDPGGPITTWPNIVDITEAGNN